MTLTAKYSESHDRVTVNVKLNDAQKSNLRLNSSRSRDSMSCTGAVKGEHLRAIMPQFSLLVNKTTPGHAMKAMQAAFHGAASIEAGIAIVQAYTVEGVKNDPRFQHNVKP